VPNGPGVGASFLGSGFLVETSGSSTFERG